MQLKGFNIEFIKRVYEDVNFNIKASAVMKNINTNSISFIELNKSEINLAQFKLIELDSSDKIIKYIKSIFSNVQFKYLANSDTESFEKIKNTSNLLLKFNNKEYSSQYI